MNNFLKKYLYEDTADDLREKMVLWAKKRKETIEASNKPKSVLIAPTSDDRAVDARRQAERSIATIEKKLKSTPAELPAPPKTEFKKEEIKDLIHTLVFDHPIDPTDSLPEHIEHTFRAHPELLAKAKENIKLIKGLHLAASSTKSISPLSLDYIEDRDSRLARLDATGGKDVSYSGPFGDPVVLSGTGARLAKEKERKYTADAIFAVQKAKRINPQDEIYKTNSGILNSAFAGAEGHIKSIQYSKGFQGVYTPQHITDILATAAKHALHQAVEHHIRNRFGANAVDLAKKQPQDSSPTLHLINGAIIRDNSQGTALNTSYVPQTSLKRLQQVDATRKQPKLHLDIITNNTINAAHTALSKHNKQQPESGLNVDEHNLEHIERQLTALAIPYTKE